MCIYMSLQRSTSHHGVEEGDEFVGAIINTSAGGSSGGDDDDPVD
jgi:hypothetical protein